MAKTEIEKAVEQIGNVQVVERKAHFVRKDVYKDMDYHANPKLLEPLFRYVVVLNIGGRQVEYKANRTFRNRKTEYKNLLSLVGFAHLGLRSSKVRDAIFELHGKIKDDDEKTIAEEAQKPEYLEEVKKIQERMKKAEERRIYKNTLETVKHVVKEGMKGMDNISEKKAETLLREILPMFVEVMSKERLTAVWDEVVTDKIINV